MTPAQSAARASALLAQANGYLNLRIEKKRLLRADVRRAIDMVQQALDLLRTLDARPPAAVLSRFSGEAGDDHAEATSTSGIRAKPGTRRQAES